MESELHMAHRIYLHHDRSNNIQPSSTRLLLRIGHAPGGSRALQQKHGDASYPSYEVEGWWHRYHIVVVSYAIEFEDRLLSVAAQEEIHEALLTLGRGQVVTGEKVEQSHLCWEW